jgi:hypothetical protein
MHLPRLRARAVRAAMQRCSRAWDSGIQEVRTVALDGRLDQSLAGGVAVSRV